MNPPTLTKSPPFPSSISKLYDIIALLPLSELRIKGRVTVILVSSVSASTKRGEEVGTLGAPAKRIELI